MPTLDAYRKDTRREDVIEAWQAMAEQERTGPLDALHADLTAMLAKVQAVHAGGINLIDAICGLELAIADVEFEQERRA